MKTDVLIPLPRLFSWDECLWYLDRNFNDCLFRVEGRTLTRLIIIGGKRLLLQITEINGSLSVTALNEKMTDADIKQVRDYIIRWFDLERDLVPFYKLLQQNTQLAFMAEQYAGLRMVGIPDLHEALCWCIIGQQINLTFAHTLKRRLTEQYGDLLEYNGYIYYAFPEPIVLAGVTVEELKLLQYSTRKAEYIIGVSQLIAAGELSKEQLSQLPAFEAQVAALLDIRGIGIWTANYVLMKSLGRTESITYGDAGLHKALQMIAGFEKHPSVASVNEYFKPFKGWEAYLVFYFWRTLS